MHVYVLGLLCLWICLFICLFVYLDGWLVTHVLVSFDFVLSFVSCCRCDHGLSTSFPYLGKWICSILFKKSQCRYCLAVCKCVLIRRYIDIDVYVYMCICVCLFV